MYRDDLEAALERADDLERELDRARAELSVDEKKIAELEQQLAEARKQAKQSKSEKQAKADKEKAEKQKAAKLAEAAKLAKGEEKAEADEAEQAAGSEAPRRKWGGLAAAIALLAIIAGGGIYAFTVFSDKPPPPPLPPGAPTPPVTKPGELVDVTRDLGTAFGMARKHFPDPELRKFDASYVDEQGIAHLAFSGSEVRYYFMSPSRAAAPEPPSKLPLGAPHPLVRPFCKLTVVTRRDNPLWVSEGSDGETDCGQAIPTPRCSAVEVWAKARKLGAPAGAVASLAYGRSGWQFEIDDGNRRVFHEQIPDSCPPH
jgi:hypothetical protein